jgi:hypothetical protein
MRAPRPLLATVLLASVSACGAGQGVFLTVIPAPAQHALVIENNTERPIQLKRDITVKSKGSKIDAGLLYVRASCTNDDGSVYEPPECVTVLPRTTMRIAPWNDSNGDSQCVCEECGPVPKAQYQFEIQSCDGGKTWQSPEFDGGH